jgi:hypothetical protein
MTAGTLMLAWLLAAGPVPGDVYHINQRQLRIPISVDPARRSEIKELILFMSPDEGKTWNEQAFASPDQDAFPFFAPKDGTYWFTVCVVNQQNKREPADPYTVPPNQKIVIDTLRPVVRIKSAERQGDEIAVAWEIQEDHPDLASLKLDYRTSESVSNVWSPAPLQQATSGQTRFKVASAGPVSLRLQMQDLAGNGSVADAEVPAAAGAAATSAVSAIPPAPVTPAPVPPVQPASTNLPPIPSGPTGAVPASAWQTTAPSQPLPTLRNEGKPALDPGSVIQPVPPYSPAPAPNDAGAKLVATSDNSGVAIPAAAGMGPRTLRAPLPPLQIVNTKQISLDYEVTKTGPSGIDRVELWITRDDGKTWDKFTENSGVKPPITVDLPGEGVFGFRLVLKSKAGLAQSPPAPNTPPEMRIELDTTPPVAKLFRPEPDPKQIDTLILTWDATDRNLAPNPITIQWAADQRDKEWHTIVADHPNDGHYSWKLPPQIPYLVHMRLITRDTAGNTSSAETQEAICIDLVQPAGVLKGIAVNRQPMTPDTASSLGPR